MKITEAILSFNGLENTSTNALSRVLTIRSLTGTDEFNTNNAKSINLVAADLYVELANSSDFGEGNLSVTHNRKYYLSTAARLYRENGEPQKATSLSKSIVVTGKSTNRW